MMAAAPTAREIAPVRMASAPSSAPTVFCCSIFSGAGRAPARSRMARLLALSEVKLPVIWPLPVVMALWMVGAEMILPSRTMAKRWPMLLLVVSPNRLAPWALKRIETEAPPVWLSKAWRASVSISPVTKARFFTSSTASRESLSETGSSTEPGGTRPAAASATLTDSSTIWKVSLAV